MESQKCAVAVIGLGAMGAATLYYLSKKLGAKVIGLEAYSIPHDKGSYHGETRLFRMSYHEGSVYIPFLKKAENLWKTMEKEMGQNLFFQSGAVYLGNHGEGNIQKPLKSAISFGFPHKTYPQGTVTNHISAIQTAKDTHAFFDERAGYILSEKAVVSMVQQAEKNGAQIYQNSPVKKLKDHCIVLDNGQEIHADHIVVSSGAYINALCPFLENHVKVVRATTARFKAKQGFEELFQPNHFFPFVIKEAAGKRFFYGFPDLGNGVKIGCFNADRPKGKVPSDLDARPQQNEIDKLSYCVEKYFPHLSVSPFAIETGLMADTADENFIIDCVPKSSHVTVVSACSGHGFKFSPVIGKCVADHILFQCPLPPEFKFKGVC